MAAAAEPDYKDAAGGQVIVGHNYILGLSDVFDGYLTRAPHLRASMERDLGIGREVKVLIKEHNDRFDAVDVWYEFVNPEGNKYPPKWASNEVKFIPIQDPSPAQGGKRSKRRKKRRRTRKN
jgi:hypothetical protein